MKTALLIFGLASFNLFAQDGSTPGCLANVEVPQSFSPNGDYDKDVFFIAFPCVPASFEIKIYNSWGTPVFESNEFTFRWTGTDGTGVAQPDGVYVYTMTYTDESQTYNLSGEISLIH